MNNKKNNCRYHTFTVIGTVVIIMSGKCTKLNFCFKTNIIMPDYILALSTTLKLALNILFFIFPCRQVCLEAGFWRWTSFTNFCWSSWHRSRTRLTSPWDNSCRRTTGVRWFTDNYTGNRRFLMTWQSTTRHTLQWVCSSWTTWNIQKNHLKIVKLALTDNLNQISPV